MRDNKSLSIYGNLLFERQDYIRSSINISTGSHVLFRMYEEQKDLFQRPAPNHRIYTPIQRDQI